MSNTPKPRTNRYAVEIINEDGTNAIYGPYTDRQAGLAVKKIESHYKRLARLLDEDAADITPSASIILLEKWSPDALPQRQPRRPKCPGCKQKMVVKEDEADGPVAVCASWQCADQMPRQIELFAGKWRLVRRQKHKGA